MYLAQEILDDLKAIHQLGEGWVVEETLAIAVYCAIKYEDDFDQALTAAVTAAHEGDEAAAQAGLEACGQAGADGIRAYIDSGIKPGNSPVTISGGWIYNRVARKGVLVGGKGFDKPLYETGELYNSFSYEVKSR